MLNYNNNVVGSAQSGNMSTSSVQPTAPIVATNEGMHDTYAILLEWYVCIYSITLCIRTIFSVSEFRLLFRYDEGR